MRKIFFLLVLLFCMPVLTFATVEKSAEEPLSLSAILSQLLDHYVLYQVQPGDTLEKIAKDHATTIEFIKKINKLKDSHIQAGQQLSLWNAPFTIEVSKSENRLYLNLDNTTIKEYAVSTGKADSLTPLGEFTIESRYPNPTWFHKGKVVPGGTPENWLGTRWLGFNKPKYGIHGTIFPEQIGQSVSGGCVRMRNVDIEELYEYIPIGTKVSINE